MDPVAGCRLVEEAHEADETEGGEPFPFQIEEAASEMIG